MKNITARTKGVEKLMSNLQPDKVTRPDMHDSGTAFEAAVSWDCSNTGTSVPIKSRLRTSAERLDHGSCCPPQKHSFQFDTQQILWMP